MVLCRLYPREVEGVRELEIKAGFGKRPCGGGVKKINMCGDVR